MIVQMILGQVGKFPHLELDAMDPLLIQGVAGYLHNHHIHLLVLHLPEDPLQIHAFRCGALGIDDKIADHIPNGAD